MTKLFTKLTNSEKHAFKIVLSNIKIDTIQTLDNDEADLPISYRLNVKRGQHYSL